MSTIIGFASQKGGVGKSTLARAVAREAAKSGLSVKIGDLDTQQGTSVKWNLRRQTAQRTPEVQVESFATAASAIKIANQFDLLLLDGPARASRGTLEIALHAEYAYNPSHSSTCFFHSMTACKRLQHCRFMHFRAYNLYGLICCPIGRLGYNHPCQL